MVAIYLEKVKKDPGRLERMKLNHVNSTLIIACPENINGLLRLASLPLSISLVINPPHKCWRGGKGRTDQEQILNRSSKYVLNEITSDHYKHPRSSQHHLSSVWL